MKNNARSIFKKEKKSSTLSYAVLIGLIIVARASVIDYNHIPSGSMLPTLSVGDEVLVNKMAYDLKVPFIGTVIKHISDPKRGDIVTFTEDNTLLIKRIMAVPGDTVYVKDDMVYVNGKQIPVKPLTAEQSQQLMKEQGENIPAQFYQQEVNGKTNTIQLLNIGNTQLSNMESITVPNDEYLMIGDNRRNSKDSRFFGLVKRSQIIGKATRILIHFKSYLFGLFPSSLPSFNHSLNKL